MIVQPLPVRSFFSIEDISNKLFFSPTANTMKSLTFTQDSERGFNERLLVILGFVKVRKIELIGILPNRLSFSRMNKQDVNAVK